MGADAGTEAARLLAQLDAAFEGDPVHSLLANLASVRGEDWTRLPPGGERSIRDIVQHAGGSKLMHADRAFGGGGLDAGDPRVRGEGALGAPEAAIAWLREAHAALRAGAAALGGAALGAELPTPWGGALSARDLLASTLRHDLYHAGEINHLRALAQADDAWAWQEGADRSRS